MKKILLVLVAFALFTPNLYSQKIAHTFKWEAVTIDGGAYIGISNSRKKALLEIETLVANKHGTHHVVDYEIRYSPMKQVSSKNIYEEFLSTTPNRSTYVFLSKTDLEALNIERDWGRYNSLEFYQNALNIKKQKTAEKRLVNDVLVYNKFLFLTKNKKSKEIYLTQTSEK